MIAAYETVLSLLQLPDNSQDELVKTLLPIIQDDVIDYTGNHFIDSSVYLSDDGISFTASSRTIAHDESGFVDALFYANMDIYVEGSYHNDGHYELESVAAGSIVVKNYHSLIDEAAGRGVYVWKVKYPTALIPIVAKMIKFHIDPEKIDGIESRSLGDFSEKYATVGGNEYPAAIAKALDRYRCVTWV